jgi:Arrestin (or S-antigen), C-terminal domain
MDERPQRRNQVRMALRLVQYAPPELQRAAAPRLTLEKHFLLREGTVRLDVALDRKWYQHGMPLNVSLKVHNGSSRIVRKIRVSCHLPHSFNFDKFFCKGLFTQKSPRKLSKKIPKKSQKNPKKIPKNPKKNPKNPKSPKNPKNH